MKRGEIARLTGVNIETLRYYEKRGLIPKPDRTSSGYRDYSDDYVDRIRFIRRAQELGFTLAEIGELLDLRIEPEADRTAVRSHAEAKLNSIRDKMDDLRKMQEALERLIARCSCSGAEDPCPILQAMQD